MPAHMKCGKEGQVETKNILKGLIENGSDSAKISV